MPTPHPTGSRQQPPEGIYLAASDGEPLRITNFRDQLAVPSQVKERSALVRAATNHGVALEDDALHAIARALTDPGAAASALRQGLVATDSVGPVDVSLINGHMYLTELLVLMQPRAGGYAYSVDPPRIIGLMGEEGPEPMLEIRFHDEGHLRDLIKQTVIQTKTYGTDYSSSILSKRVSRPVLTHAALVSFEDGTDAFVVIVVRDGISRIVSSWSALKPDLNRDELAEFIADRVLARRGARTTTETAARARGRENVNAEMRAQFTAGTIEETPDEAAVRIGQTFTMPVQQIVHVKQTGASQVGDEEMFDDTVQAVIASIHGEFRPWDAGATQSSAILRALPRAVHTGNLDADVAAMAAGTLTVADMKRVFGNAAPETALWRAVYLLCWLGHPDEYNGLKRELKGLLGLSQLRNRTYSAHLATIVDGPWRRDKAHSERQARRAWANGGALPGSFLDSSWEPVPVEDFRDLVGPAYDDNDQNARRTLQVAGGVALIADKLLMSNVGSAMESGVVPFRSDVDTVIEGLGRTKRGLYLLAHAANAFEPERQAINSFTKTELNTLPDDVLKNAYIVPRPGKSRPQVPARDTAGNLYRLRPWDVVAISDPVRAAEAEQQRLDAAADAPIETAHEKAERLRRAVANRLAAVADDAAVLVALAVSDGAVVGGAFGSVADYAALDRSMRQLQLLILSNPPAPDGAPVDEDDSSVGEEE